MISKKFSEQAVVWEHQHSFKVYHKIPYGNAVKWRKSDQKIVTFMVFYNVFLIAFSLWNHDQNWMLKPHNWQGDINLDLKPILNL